MARPSNSDKATKELERLRQANDIYNVMFPEWKLYLSAYEGGPRFFAGNLHTHARENAADFEARMRRVHYINYCEPLVDFFTNFIFSEPITRQSADPFFADFINDVDKAETHIDAFMQEVCSDMQIYGTAYTLVEAPRESELVLSVADVQDLNIRPYWISISPFEILDWSMDNFGKYTYAKRRELTRDARSGIRTEKFTEYTPEDITVTVIDVSDEGRPAILSVDKFPNNIMQVPLVATKYKKSKVYPSIGNSFLVDLSRNNREIMNQTSLLQEFLYRQAFNILTVQTDISNTGQPQIVGYGNVMEYPREAARPEYISPPVAPAEMIQSEIQRIKREMFSKAAQDTVNELFNGEAKSGFSQSQSFAKTVPFISTRADKLEETEQRLMKLTMSYLGKEWDGVIKYKDRYEITSLVDSLTQLLILVQDFKIPSETFVKEELKRVTREFDGKLTEEMKAKIAKEIEEMDFESWQSELKTKGTSPGAQQKPKSTGTLQEAAQEARVSSTNKVV